MKDKSFQEIKLLFEKSVSNIMDPQDYFSSSEYSILMKSAEIVFNKARPKIKKYLRIIKGTNTDHNTEDQNIRKTLCFPSRFLNKPSTNALEATSKETVNDIIENIFLLGLVSHLLLYKFPTRARIKKLDMERIIQDWILKTLIADRKMRTYSKDINDLPLRIFGFFYKQKIEPTLKNQLNMNIWRFWQCRSFFRNLFFAGSLLGMTIDIATKE